MACCSHRPIAGTRVDDRFAGGACIGRRGRLPPIPEDDLPSLELILGRQRACTIPSVRRCPVGLLPPLLEPVLWQGRVVLSSHAGPSEGNDDLLVRGIVKLSRGPALTPSAGVGEIFFRRSLARQESLYEGRARRRHPREGRAEGGTPLGGGLLVGQLRPARAVLILSLLGLYCLIVGFGVPVTFTGPPSKVDQNIIVVSSFFKQI